MIVADTELVVPRYKRRYYLLELAGALVAALLLPLTATGPDVKAPDVIHTGQMVRPPAVLNAQPKAQSATSVFLPNQSQQIEVTKLPFAQAAATPTEHTLRHRVNRHHKKSVVNPAVTPLQKLTDSQRAKGHKLTLEESFPDEEPQSPETALAGSAAVPTPADEAVTRRHCQDAAKNFLFNLELDERSPINPHPASFQEGSYRRYLYNQFARELVRCEYWGGRQTVQP